MKILSIMLLTAGCIHAQVSGNTVRVTPSGANTGELQILELTTNGTDYFGISGAPSMAATLRFQAPAAPPATGDCFSIGAISGGKYPILFAPCGSLPVVDTTAIVKGSSDATKLLKFNVSALTTATARTMAIPDVDQILAGRNVDNNFSAGQTFNINDLTLKRLAGAFQRISFDAAGGTSNDWTVGIEDSVITPGVGDSAFIVKNNGVSGFVLEQSGDATLTGGLTATSVNAATGAFTTSRFGQLRYSGFANTLFLDGSTGNLTNIGSIAMSGGITGLTSCTGAGCGVNLSANNVFTGTDAFDKGVYLKSFATTPGFSPAAGYGALTHFANSVYWYWNGTGWGSVDLSSANLTSSAPITIVSHDIRCTTCFLTTGGQAVSGTSTFADINATNVAATSTVSAATLTGTTVRLTEIRFGGLSNTLLFNGATADLTNVHDISASGVIGAGGVSANTVSFTTLVKGLNTVITSGGTLQNIGDISMSGNFLKVGTTTFAGPISVPSCTGCGGIGSVTGTSPIVSSGGSTPAISCPTCFTTSGGQSVAGTSTFANLTTTGNVSFGVNSPVLSRLAGAFQRIVFDAAGGTATDWTAGVEDSVIAPGVGDSAFIIRNNTTNRMVLEQSGDATFSNAVNAGSMVATTGTFTTLRINQLRYSGFANTLYLDGSTGVLSNISTATIGTLNVTTCVGCPGGSLPIVVTGANGSGGAVAEVSNTLVDFGMNDVRFGTQVNAQQGGFQRIDSRPGEILNQWWGRAAAATSPSLIMALSNAGRLDVNGTTDQLTWLTAATGNSTYLEMGPSGIWTEFQTNASGNFGFGHYGVNANVFQSIRAGAVVNTLVLDSGQARTSNSLVTAATTVAPLFEVRGDAASANMTATTYSGLAGFIGKTAKGSLATPTAVTANTQLASVGGLGYQGVFGSGGGFTTAPSAMMGIYAGETWDPTHQGSFITFGTTATATTTRTEVLRIGSTGLFNSVQATNAGFYTNLGFTTDQAFYAKSFATATMNTPGASYGALAYKSGSQYWYWNGSAYASVDLSATSGACGSNQQILYNNSGVCGASSVLTFDGSFLNANTLRIRGNDSFQIYEQQSSTILRLATASGNIMLSPGTSTTTAFEFTTAGDAKIHGGGSLILERASRTTTEKILFSNTASGSNGNWFAGTDASTITGGASAFTINYQSTNVFKVEENGTTVVDQLSANSVGAGSVSGTTVSFTTLVKGFSTIITSGGALQNIGSISMSGTISGATNMVSSVTASSPLASSGGTTPNITCPSCPSLAGSNTWTNSNTFSAGATISSGLNADSAQFTSNIGIFSMTMGLDTLINNSRAIRGSSFGILGVGAGTTTSIVIAGCTITVNGGIILSKSGAC